ncbi:MAG: ATP phosphoribosyltransferase regulatory subunit [Myxococcota bacterium]
MPESSYFPPADPGSSAGVYALSHPVPAGMRDLLPPEAWRHADLARRILKAFELAGYELVVVPLFEFADVVERGLGGLESHEVLRFVEPESGAVVSLRPDMTPQVARLLATRLAAAPPPARLCYQGSVLRRRQERARRHRQIPQAGIELIGREGPVGDLEVLSVAVAALRRTGLVDFTIDLGHARIAAALVEPVEAGRAKEILDALEVKDETEVVRRAERARLDARALKALAELPALHGGTEVWSKAESVLSLTAAEPALRELKQLWEAACRAELAPQILVDLGETRDFAYYSGALFQVHAEGPGRPLGAGGRYDGLLDRFGASRPAVGFAFGLDDVAWALKRAGLLPSPPARVLLGAGAAELAEKLRAAGIATANAPEGDEGLAYARAWRYSHVLEALAGEYTLVDSASQRREPLPKDQSALVSTLVSRLGISTGGS